MAPAKWDPDLNGRNRQYYALCISPMRARLVAWIIRSRASYGAYQWLQPKPHKERNQRRGLRCVNDFPALAAKNTLDSSFSNTKHPSILPASPLKSCCEPLPLSLRPRSLHLNLYHLRFFYAVFVSFYAVFVSFFAVFVSFYAVFVSFCAVFVSFYAVFVSFYAVFVLKMIGLARVALACCGADGVRRDAEPRRCQLAAREYRRVDTPGAILCALFCI